MTSHTCHAIFVIADVQAVESPPPSPPTENTNANYHLSPAPLAWSALWGSINLQIITILKLSSTVLQSQTKDNLCGYQLDGFDSKISLVGVTGGSTLLKVLP